MNIHSYDSIKLLIKKNLPLAAEIIRFNANEAVNLHPSYRQLIIPELPENGWNNKRLTSRISKIISSQENLKNCWYLETRNLLWPVALMTPQRLHRLALHLGALVLGGAIRSSLSREQVAVWKKKLGDETYRFALNSASLLSSAQLPKPVIPLESPLDLGNGIILMAIRDEPEPLKARISLKLPKNTKSCFIEPNKAKRLVHFVTQILEAEWYSSCAVLRHQSDQWQSTR